MDNQKKKITERLDVWADECSVQILAACSNGDPIDCSPEEARAFAQRILAAVRQAAGEICPSCGFMLDFAPWIGNSASDEMCPSCGIHFGFDDAAGGNFQLRQEIYRAWREKWIKNGKKWS